MYTLLPHGVIRKAERLLCLWVILYQADAFGHARVGPLTALQGALRRGLMVFQAFPGTPSLPASRCIHPAYAVPNCRRLANSAALGSCANTFMSSSTPAKATSSPRPGAVLLFNFRLWNKRRLDQLRARGLRLWQRRVD